MTCLSASENRVRRFAQRLPTLETQNKRSLLINGLFPVRSPRAFAGGQISLKGFSLPELELKHPEAVPCLQHLNINVLKTYEHV